MDYQLTEKTIITEDGIRAEVWGVIFTEAEKEVAEFPDVSPDVALARRFAELCLKNSVSQVHLHDVLEDCLAVGD
ncbi:MAG TPA: DUF6514 family protein [Oscillospiraceae bacterium]|nr:hypothetical protein [Oscillospiraceae bacterium]HNW04835.1 DUF6514 family protein [Oscillospiraceae bacterium]HPW00658.1 DUF6514 family protein [Oscillospiraceae bacterium]